MFRTVLFSLSLGLLAHAQDAATEARLIKNPRQLILEGKRSGEGYFHPDGNALIFQSERDEGNPFYQIYLLDLVSGDTSRVSPGAGKTTCAFFQPGTSRVLFASTHHEPEAAAKQKAELEFRASGKTRRYSWDYDATMDIFSANRDGTGLVQLTKERGYDAEAAFSPDGKQIVFCSLRGANRFLTSEELARLEKDPASFGDIYTMNADGSDVRRLTTSPGYDGGPFFSPDGQRIVWRRFDASGMNADVFTMKTDGSDVKRVTDFGSMSWAPFYHPSGRYLVFTSNKHGFENFELFIVDAAGEKEPVRVSFTPGFDGLPVFSPDGKKLCWTTNRTADAKSQLWLADWDDTAARKALEEAPARPAPESTATNATLPNVGSLLLTPAISAEDLRLEVSWLAAPARGGRMTGSPGAQAAAEFIAEYFKKVGVQPVGDSFFQAFDFNAGEKLLPDKNSLTVSVADKPAAPLAVDQDFRPLAFTENAQVEGDVVFAGYGLSVPEGGKAGSANARYNSYEGLEVKDKIVLILRYVPEGVDPSRRAQLNRYAGIRYKAMMARERGAKAVIFVTGPNSPNPGELLPLSGDNTLAGSGIVAASISGKVADALFAVSDKNLKELQTALDTENPHADGGFVLPKVGVKLACAVEHVKKQDRNVLAVIPPEAHPTSRGDAGANEAKGTHAPPPEYLLVGAHYDHLGQGRNGSSMARAGEEQQVHPGADDNGSGVAVVLELAASLAEERTKHPEKFRRGIIFACWSGEEIGLIGSAAFAEKPPVPLAQIAGYVNFDMVGRLRENKLTVQGVGSSKAWRRLLEKRNVAAGFNLVLQDDPYLPTDTTSLYPKRLPVLNFFTGAHEDYHRPTDTAEKLDYPGTERIANFARALLLDLVSAPERPDFARVERSEQPGGGRDNLRAYLGTIPDYTTEVKGVKISGVRAGSPAEKGGLQGGDILVEFAGQKLANIYDYTYALDAVKIGQPVKIVVERETRRIEVTVTPEARK